MTQQPPAPQGLNEHARKWVDKLPAETRPKTLEEQFPRILNRISSLWRHPEELMEYLNELIVDSRGDRAGFPMAVATELVNIKDYYEMNVHPDSKSYLWDPRRRDETPLEYERAKGPGSKAAEVEDKDKDKA